MSNHLISSSNEPTQANFQRSLATSSLWSCLQTLRIRMISALLPK